MHQEHKRWFFALKNVFNSSHYFTYLHNIFSWSVTEFLSLVLCRKYPGDNVQLKTREGFVQSLNPLAIYPDIQEQIMKMHFSLISNRFLHMYTGNFKSLLHYSFEIVFPWFLVPWFFSPSRLLQPKLFYKWPDCTTHSTKETRMLTGGKKILVPTDSEFICRHLFIEIRFQTTWIYLQILTNHEHTQNSKSIK